VRLLRSHHGRYDPTAAIRSRGGTDVSQRTGPREASQDEKVSQLRAIAERVEEDLLAARHLIEGILEGMREREAAYAQPWKEWLSGAAACHDELVRLANAVATADHNRQGQGGRDR
jgi:hypothetical protein